MAGTWAGDVQRWGAELCQARSSFLLSCRSGVNVKVTLRHAPDVRNYIRAMERLQKLHAPAGLVGCGSILLPQLYSKDAMEVAVNNIQRMAVAGEMFSRQSMEEIINDVNKLPKNSQGKRKGRAAMQMGSHFVQNQLRTEVAFARFLKVGELAEQWVRGQASPKFADMVHALRTLDGVSYYHGVRIARSIACVRAETGMGQVSIQVDEWPLLRDMGGGPSKGFAILGVADFEDAQRCFRAIKLFLGVGSPNVRKMTLFDLPCGNLCSTCPRRSLHFQRNTFSAHFQR